MVTTTRYLYFGNQYVGETDENGTLQKRYVNEPDEYTHLLAQLEVSSSSSHTYHYDAVGSTRQVSDKAEAVTDEFTYDAWGNRLARSGPSETHFQYIGERGYYRDDETEQYYVMARTYDPACIRWLSVDPLGAPFSIPNSYWYADNRPLFMLDFTGMESTTYSGDGYKVECAKQTYGIEIRTCVLTYDGPSDPEKCKCCGGYLLSKMDITWCNRDTKPPEIQGLAQTTPARLLPNPLQGERCGYYRYYFEGVISQEMIVNLTRYHGNHDGPREFPGDSKEEKEKNWSRYIAASMDTRNTEGTVFIDYEYKCFYSKGLEQFEPPIKHRRLQPERGGPTEVNYHPAEGEDHRRPNRIRTAKRTTLPWKEEMPAIWLEEARGWLISRFDFRWSHDDKNNLTISGKVNQHYGIPCD